MMPLCTTDGGPARSDPDLSETSTLHPSELRTEMIILSITEETLELLMSTLS